MIIHKLIAQHLKGGDNQDFYLLQARDAIAWIERHGGRAGEGVSALDLGCGHGIFGAELIKRGCQVTFADEENFLPPELQSARFLRINLDRDELAPLGKYDLVICSNVLEHLSRPESFLDHLDCLLNPAGHGYLSWTNWLSPWGGHEFSPFHYLGSGSGHLLYDRFRARPRKHTPFRNLFPTYIGPVLKRLRRHPALRVIRVAPRYYPEFGFITRIPVLREFATWNCAVLFARA